MEYIRGAFTFQMRPYLIRFIFLAGFFSLFCHNFVFAQKTIQESMLRDVEIRTDTAVFRFSEDRLYHQREYNLPFYFRDDEAVAEVRLEFPSYHKITQIQLMPSSDFTLQDSILIFEDFARFKVRFTDVTSSEFLSFTLKIFKDSVTSETVDIPLLPYTDTHAELQTNNTDLFVGEEKSIEITSNNIDNIVVDNKWTEGLPINYRISKEDRHIMLHLVPNTVGEHTLNIPLRTHKPGMENGVIQYEIEAIQQNFTVKTGRIAFLALDKQEVTFTEGNTDPIEIQLDNHRFLQMGKTYRLENQEEPGGALIAEIFTKSALNNNKVLCLLRTYAYHRKSEGYLYIKDGDVARFVTNIDITPQTQINQISIQLDGQNWQNSSIVHPGETINIRLEGQGLHKGNFTFYGAPIQPTDSLIRNENMVVYRVRIPLDVSTKKIEIYNHGKSTGKALEVQEYQQPKEFSFINLDLGSEVHPLNEISRPIYYEHTLTDVVFDFDRREIDTPEELNGVQYINIKVKISNKQGNLIELYQFENLVICPGERSPRFTFYNNKDCLLENINLNDFINRKTHSLEEWSTIDFEFSHNKDQYGGEGFTKRVKIVLKRRVNFDVDVSFPAGLLILKSNENDFSNFGGISFAMIAQMSFYHPEKIAKYRPYKIGAGFIALDAFNFGESVNRDLGLVVLGSLYPTSSENRLSFPLYAGFGYLLQEKKTFFLIGPGIRVSF